MQMIKDTVCPLIIKLASNEKQDFSLAVRLMRVSQSIVKNFHSILVFPCQSIFSIYSKILESEYAPEWHIVLVMESYHAICADKDWSRSIFESFDGNELTANLFSGIILNCTKVVMKFQSLLLGSENAGDPFSESTSSIKMRL
jgi:hypothetical protein